MGVTGGCRRGQSMKGPYRLLWKSLRNLIPLPLTKFGETGTRAHAVIVTQERLKLRKWKTKITPLQQHCYSSTYC